MGIYSAQQLECQRIMDFLRLFQHQGTGNISQSMGNYQLWEFNQLIIPWFREFVTDPGGITKVSESPLYQWLIPCIIPMTDPYVCQTNGNIYHQYTPFMLAYIPYMDPSWLRGLSMIINGGLFPSNSSNVLVAGWCTWSSEAMWSTIGQSHRKKCLTNRRRGMILRVVVNGEIYRTDEELAKNW